MVSDVTSGATGTWLAKLFILIRISSCVSYRAFEVILHKRLLFGSLHALSMKFNHINIQILTGLIRCPVGGM